MRWSWPKFRLFQKKTPQKRDFQLRFEGFSDVKESRRAVGIRIFHQILNLIKDFCIAIWQYSLFKARQVGQGFKFLALWVGKTPQRVKDSLISKLIWSRGRLGKPIATTIIMLGAFLIFTFGEVFSGSKLVNSQELHPDYLYSSVDIIPQKNLSLTEIPKDRKGTKPFNYTIQGGDTLSSIGAKFRISVDALKYVNGLTDSSILQVGKTLIIPPVTGLIHKVESGDTLSSIAEKYDVPVQAVADFNYILDTSKLAIGTELVIPDGKVPEQVIPVYTPTIPSLGPTQAPSSDHSYCVWPSSTRIISQYFSWYHNGVDIASANGTAMPPLYSCAGGVITRSGWDPFGLGLHVRIDHGNGFETVYGHMSRIDVGYGERVSRGQVIGIMGSTGRSTGPHVHFMIIYNGIPQNPLNYTN